MTLVKEIKFNTVELNEKPYSEEEVAPEDALYLHLLELGKGTVFTMNREQRTAFCGGKSTDLIGL